MERKENAYCAIASLYERLMKAQIDYGEWADYVYSLIRKYTQGSTGADAGCGSGAFTRRFKKMGLDVTGYDISEDMLSQAISQTREEGMNITFVKQDVRNFRSMKKLHFITALTDCINYVPEKDLVKTFKNFHTSLLKGGVLIFDISTEYKLKQVIGSNMFGEDDEDFTYVWFNTPFDGGVEMDISLFSKTSNGLYEKKEEHHVQYAHSVQTIVSALEKSGFEQIEIQGHLGSEVTQTSQRINFVAVKK